MTNQKGHRQSNEPIKRAADTRRGKTCVGCVRARVYFRLNEKESSEPIKLKVCVTDAKREKTRAKKRRLLFHAMYKKVTIGFVFNFDWLCRKLREFFKLIFRPTWLILIESS